MSSNIDDSAIGERLHQVRLELRMSQQALADSLGISLRTYQNYERGDRPVSKEFLCAIMEVHGVDASWLLTGRDLGGSTATDSDIDMEVFDEVVSVLRGPDSDFQKLNGADFARYAAHIYNQANAVDDADVRRKIIAGAVRMLSLDVHRQHLAAIEGKQGELYDGLRDVYLKRIDELDSVENRRSNTETTSVEQHIEGTNHQIAGRDLVNNGGKGSKKK